MIVTSVIRDRSHTAVAMLSAKLLRGRNADGAWGYYPGKASRIEPTCWAALSLSRAGELHADGEHRVLDWLTLRQRGDGFIADVTGEPPNVGFNGLGAAVIQDTMAWPGERLQRLVSAIGRTKGAAIEPGHARQDNSLQGWSWIEGTFSWIEPTAWCLLVLKKSTGLLPGDEKDARIREAERLLLDRVCQSGGWNYGNANMLGQDLPAHVPTTALALLALQDRREHPSVQQSLEYLVRRRLAEPAGMALALTSICLHVYGVAAPDVSERLAALAGRHAFLDNLHVSAMVLYSLTVHEHDANAFRM